MSLVFPSFMSGEKDIFVIEKALIERELVLRKLRLPPESRLTRKALLRWVALSLGLITPGESRDAVIPVLDGLFNFHTKYRGASVSELMDYMASQEYTVTEKTLRYQLMKLRQSGLVEKKENLYSFVKDPYSDDLKAGIFSSLDSVYSETKGRLEEAFSSLFSQYSQE